MRAPLRTLEDCRWSSDGSTPLRRWSSAAGDARPFAVFDRSYLSCAYAPMIELLAYLEANGFSNYIASGERAA
jgi:hypothetical protein